MSSTGDAWGADFRWVELMEASPSRAPRGKSKAVLASSIQTVRGPPRLRMWKGATS